MTFAADLKISIAERLPKGQVDLVENLRFLYHLMVASENLLEVGRLAAQDDELRDFYTRHLDEERGHAQWLEADLIAADLGVGPIKRCAMLAAGVQYYLQFHVNPASLLGYMAVLECFPISAGTLADLEAKVGPILLRTIRHHAEADPQHGAELLAFIDTRPFIDQASIYESAMMTCSFLTEAAQQMEPRNG